MDKVSFIIPTLNEESKIGVCVKAIKPQLRAGDEIIVVDNGSSDKTNQIAKSLGCKVVCESKRGLSNARNAGAQAANGHILCFIDADGKVSSNWLEQALQSLTNSKMSKALSGSKDPEISAVSGLNIFDSEDPVKRFWYNAYTVGAYTFVLSFHSLFAWTFLVGNNMAIRKEVFETLGGFEAVVGEDFWLSHNFGKKRSFKGAVNLRMIVKLSSRRFKQKGFLRTVFLEWLAGGLVKTPQVRYAILEKEILEKET